MLFDPQEYNRPGADGDCYNQAPTQFIILCLDSMLGNVLHMHMESHTSMQLSKQVILPFKRWRTTEYSNSTTTPHRSCISINREEDQPRNKFIETELMHPVGQTT
jgi:hypothetical protein